MSFVARLYPQRDRRARQAFTLIELLVVIAIIAVLAALLLPVMRSTKESANRTKCLSNLRQWGAATALYLADSAGVFPGQGSNPDKADPKPTGPTNAWFQVLPPYLEEEPMAELWKKNAIPRPGDKSIFVCPSSKPVSTIPANNGRIYYGDYAINLWIEARDRGCAGNGTPEKSGYSEFLRISQIRHASAFVVWAESPQGMGDNGQLGYEYGHTHAEYMGDPESGDAFRHNGYANVCFADGHADSYNKETIYDSNMNKYWNFGGLQWNPDNENLYGACQQ